MAQKAPGKSHRKGMTLAELFREFPDDATAEKWFAEQRWPGGPHCPYCGSTNVQSGAKHKTMPYRCREKECAKRFSVRTKTPMESSKLGFQVWAIALYQVTTNLKGLSSMKLHRDLGITQRSAWFLAHRLREAWKDHGAEFAGPVEVDETYIGGKRKNMSKAKRKELAGTGRGAVGKAVVVGARDRATNRVSAGMARGTDMASLQGFIAARAADVAKVYTDEHSGYAGMRFDHEAVNHSAGEYVRGQAHTNGIESFWATLKRAHKGTFHHFSTKHLDRYVTEFSARHNVRDLDTTDQMSQLVSRMVGKRLRYQDLTA
ncbi:MAG: IS1595 family transposase [Chloroflexota bacterium]|nr:IS1595 family transposase [Chloroflexota bacterium]